jgi:hypothetical protein
MKKTGVRVFSTQLNAQFAFAIDDRNNASLFLRQGSVWHLPAIPCALADGFFIFAFQINAILGAIRQ